MGDRRLIEISRPNVGVCLHMCTYTASRYRPLRPLISFNRRCLPSRVYCGTENIQPYRAARRFFHFARKTRRRLVISLNEIHCLPRYFCKKHRIFQICGSRRLRPRSRTRRGCFQKSSVAGLHPVAGPGKCSNWDVRAQA